MAGLAATWRSPTGVNGKRVLIMATSAPAASRTVPPPREEPPDMERIRKLVAEYSNELLV
jgi:hypothetical protein